MIPNLDNKLPIVAPASVDVDELGRLSFQEFREWYTPNRKGAEKNLQVRLKHCCRLFDSRISMTERVRSYFRELDRMEAEGEREENILRSTPLFYLAAFFGSNFEISCHELFFGISKQIELSPWLADYIERMAAFPTASRNTLLDIMKKGKFVADNPYYFLKQRVFEAACDGNIPERNLYSIGSDRSVQAALGKLILNEAHPPIYKEEPNQLHTGIGKFLMLLLYCMRLGKTADYLLLQDYSRYAMIDGKPLTATQKDWLSAFLCASRSVQNMVIGQMAVSMIGEADN